MDAARGLELELEMPQEMAAAGERKRSSSQLNHCPLLVTVSNSSSSFYSLF